MHTLKGLSIDDSVAAAGEKTPALSMSKLSSFQKAKGSSIIGNFPKTQSRSRKKRKDKGQRHESLENVPEVSEEDLSFEFSDYVIKLKDNKDSIAKVPQSKVNKTAAQLSSEGAVDIQLLVENPPRDKKEHEEEKSPFP